MQMLYCGGLACADASVTPEENEPGSSCSHARQLSASLGGNKQPREDPEKQRMVSTCSSAPCLACSSQSNAVQISERLPAGSHAGTDSGSVE